MIMRLFSTAASNKAKPDITRLKAAMSKIQIVESPNVNLVKQDKLQKLREELQQDDIQYEKKV